MKTRNKDIINYINELLKNIKTLEKICELSDNKPRNVIKNIANIINYYIKTGRIEDSIEQALSSDIEEIDGLAFIPSNSLYKNKIAIYGLIGNRIVSSRIKSLIDKLNDRLNRMDIDYANKYNYDLQDAVFKAIKVLPFYNMFFEKEDITKFRVGEEQFEYYKRVLINKLRRLGKGITEEDLLALKELVNIFLEQNPVVYITTNPNISRGYMVELPTLFKIINICAKNKGRQYHEEINPETIELVDIPVEDDKRKREVTYVRWENVVVDENFIYEHDELTGNPKQDLNLIYGKKDMHNSQDVLKRSYLENIGLIKKGNDISLKLRKGIYHICNGRHRIVYLKYFYLINCSYYDKEKFKEIFTIPFLVSHKIEDEEFNKLLNIFLEKYKGKVFKNNILNEDIDVGVIVNGHLYFVNGVDEFRELIELLDRGDIENRFLYTQYQEIEGINYREIINRLYKNKGEMICNISFKELLDLLPHNILKVIDLYELYRVFVFFVNNNLKCRLFNIKNYLLLSKDNSMDALVDKIIEILCEDLDIDITLLVKKVKENKEFSSISDEEIIEVARKFGLKDKKDENNRKKIYFL